MITATLPLLVAVGAHFLLKDRQPRTVWLGLALSLGGVLVLTGGSEAQASAPNPVLGNLLEFLAMLCATGYVLIAKKLSTRYSALVITATQTLMGSVWFGAALLTPWGSWPQHYPLDAMLWVLYLGACITLGAYGMYTWAVGKVPVALAGAFINLIPLFTLVLAWLYLDETLNTTQAFACVMVLGGVLLSQLRPRTAKD
jgi:drug/metabolite transporter (DMT)-like permease